MRSFWLEHKQDTLVVLLLIILFVGLFFLIYYFIESFDSTDLTGPARPPIFDPVMALLTTACKAKCGIQVLEAVLYARISS